ncbi:MAG: hypothetical protein ACLRZ9_12940 [Eubacterium sp.]
MIINKQNNIIQIEFGKHCNLTALSLFQYDKGQIIQFLDIPDGTQIEFTNENHERATPYIIRNSQVEIPDFLLAESSEIVAYIKVVDANSETTEKELHIPVESRQPADDGVSPENQQTFIEQIQEIMNEAKEAAQYSLIPGEGIKIENKVISAVDKWETFLDVTLEEGVNSFTFNKFADGSPLQLRECEVLCFRPASEVDAQYVYLRVHGTDYCQASLSKSKCASDNYMYINAYHFPNEKLMLARRSGDGSINTSYAFNRYQSTVIYSITSHYYGGTLSDEKPLFPAGTKILVRGVRA